MAQAHEVGVLGCSWSLGPGMGHKGRGFESSDSGFCGPSGFDFCGISPSPSASKASPSSFHALAGRPTFLASSSCTNSHNASEMARSFASSSSALVLKPPPFLASWSAISSPCFVLDAQPCVMVSLRAAASAMTWRISTPRRTGAPPSLRPEPAESVLRRSAEARA